VVDIVTMDMIMLTRSGRKRQARSPVVDIPSSIPEEPSRSGSKWKYLTSLQLRKILY